MSWLSKLRSSWARQRALQKESTLKAIANQVYRNRVLCDRPGDQHSDWAKATKIYLNPLRLAGFRLNLSLIWLEKRLIEPANRQLGRAEIFKIVDKLSPSLEAIGVLLIPIVLYFATQQYEERQEQQELERLQQQENHAQERLRQASIENYLRQISDILLNVDGDLMSKENQEIRTAATAITRAVLDDQNMSRTSRRQVVSFLIDLGFVVEQQTDSEIIPIISLSHANLIRVDLRGADLTGADLRGAYTVQADLEGADLEGADLSEAYLIGANLRGANLRRANLRGAYLTAELTNGVRDDISPYAPNLDLLGLNRKGAELEFNGRVLGANLVEADLVEADLGGVYLSGVDLTGADLTGAIVSKVMLTHATVCETTLPKNIQIDPDRDCH